MAEGWRLHAACRGHDPEVYVLDEGYGYVLPHERRDAAAQLCRGCPVTRECASDALANDDCGVVRAGVWLGEFHRDRGQRRKVLAEVASARSVPRRRVRPWGPSLS